MEVSAGLVRVVAAATISFLVMFAVQRRRRMPLADCVHRGVAAALAASILWIVVEIAAFEIRAGNP